MKYQVDGDDFYDVIEADYFHITKDEDCTPGAYFYSSRVTRPRELHSLRVDYETREEVLVGYARNPRIVKVQEERPPMANPQPLTASILPC